MQQLTHGHHRWERLDLGFNSNESRMNYLQCECHRVTNVMWYWNRNILHVSDTFLMEGQWKARGNDTLSKARKVCKRSKEPLRVLYIVRDKEHVRMWCMILGAHKWQTSIKPSKCIRHAPIDGLYTASSSRHVHIRVYDSPSTSTSSSCSASSLSPPDVPLVLFWKPATTNVV